MERNKLDIVICGSSRPELVPYCVDSVRRFIISQSRNTDFRIIYHEDFVNVAKSNKVIEWCNNNGIDKVISSNPSIGYGKGLYKALGYVNTEYMMNIQEDWEFERTGIDIDRILWTMKGFNIWSVVFNKKGNRQYRKEQFGEVDFEGLKLILVDGWRMIPSVWKTSIVKEKFQSNWTIRPEGKLINSFGSVEQRSDKKYNEDNVKSYFFGSQYDARWVRHIGNTWRVRDFGVQGKGKGCIEWDIWDLKNRPPWIPFILRPMNGLWCDEKTKDRKYWMDMLDKFPKEIKKVFVEKMN